jgi:hypothetical protein
MKNQSKSLSLRVLNMRIGGVNLPFAPMIEGGVISGKVRHRLKSKDVRAVYREFTSGRGRRMFRASNKKVAR